MTQVKAGRSNAASQSSADADLATQLTYTYDDLGNKLKETDPLNNTWTWTWDAHGNVLSRTDAKGQKTEYQWAQGHLLKTKTVRSADGSIWRTYAYTRNALGQATRMEARDGAGALVVAYDHTHDAAHRLASVTDSRGGKTISYRYSPGGLLDRKEDSDGNRWDYLYDPVGRLTGIWTPNYDYLAFTIKTRFIAPEGVTVVSESGLFPDTVPVSAVPEPETYALLLAGLGLVGFAARRRTAAA